MPARVDTRAMLVRDGAAAIAFAADCGAGAATLDPAGEPHALRLLCWREKCGLARFAEAGAEFLEAQFVTISGGAMPDDPVRCEALSALAFWLHGPDPLPFDTALLGEVTLDLCATLGIGPAELAALPAPEVEMLWHARQAAEPAPVPAIHEQLANPVLNGASGMTRIMIEPDPEEIAASPGGGTASPAGARDTAETGRREPDPLPERKSVFEPVPDALRNQGSEPVAVDPPVGLMVEREPHPLQAPVASRGPADRAASPPADVSGRRQGIRFRLRPEGERAQATEPDAGTNLPNIAFPGEGRGPVSADSRRHPAISNGSQLGPGLHRGEAVDRSNSAPGSPDRSHIGSSPSEASDDRNALGLAAAASVPVVSAQGSEAIGAARVRGASPAPQRLAAVKAPAAQADSEAEPLTPAAAAISAMISAVAPPGFSGAVLPPRPSATVQPIAVSAGPAPAIDSRLGALIDIVTRAAAPRTEAAADPDAMIDSFGDRLADAVAELGLAGAE